jgi:hypothetical protein
MGTIRELIERLKTCDLDAPVAIHLWNVEDVRGRALEKGYKVTDEQAAHILSEMERKCDSTQGLNWTVLDCYIEDIKDKLEKATCKEMEDGEACSEECDSCLAFDREPTPEENKANEDCSKTVEMRNCPRDCETCQHGKILFANFASDRKKGAIEERLKGMLP